MILSDRFSSFSVSSKSIRRISRPLIASDLAAMEAESKPFIEKLGLKQDSPSKLLGPAPCITYSGSLANGLTIHVAWNGKCQTHSCDNVGTVPASLCAYLAIQAFTPDLVISAGTAGGFKSQGASIGDIFLSSNIINHDRRIPIPGFDTYGIGKTSSTSTPALQSLLGFKSGVVSSGNSLDYTDRCMEIMKEHGAAVKEMEAAAIAWICEINKKPFLCVKSITDIVDGSRPAHEEFLENLGTAARSLQDALPRVLDFIAAKKLTEL